jgi:hypothetical protein
MLAITMEREAGNPDISVRLDSLEPAALLSRVRQVFPAHDSDASERFPRLTADNGRMLTQVAQALHLHREGRLGPPSGGFAPEPPPGPGPKEPERPDAPARPRLDEPALKKLVEDVLQSVEKATIAKQTHLREEISSWFATNQLLLAFISRAAADKVSSQEGPLYATAIDTEALLAKIEQVITSRKPKQASDIADCFRNRRPLLKLVVDGSVASARKALQSLNNSAQPNPLRGK